MENNMQESGNGPVAQDDKRVTCENDVSLKNLFDRKPRIPDYQRSFCWRKSNVLDLMETIWMREEKADTHLGTIILKQEKKADGTADRFSIVDGQQRLLTLAILALACGGREQPSLLLDASLAGTSNDARSAKKHLYWAQTTIKDWLKTRGVDTWKGNGPGVGERQYPAFLQNIKFTVITLPPGA